MPNAIAATWECEVEAFAALDLEPPEKIRETQNRLLARHIAYAAAHSPFYRNLFLRHGIDARQVQTTEALTQLPCTEKADLAEQNETFLAAPPEAIVDVCLTSSTTREEPTRVLQTASDLARLAYNEAQAFKMMGVTPADTVFIGAALDRCFMAGLAYFIGGWRGGVRMVRGGSGTSAQHWHLIQFTRPTAAMAVPSLMRRIGEFALETGADPAGMGLRKIMTIGEPVYDADLNPLPATEALARMWNAHIYSTYASTELATTFCECEARRGGHLRPELAVIEMLDETGRAVAPGEPGEIVATPLGVRGMPLVRFRTGDIATLLETPCSCGRRTVRLGPILGRKNQMLKFKGTTVFPTTIMAALEGNPAVEGGYIEVRRNDDGTDRIIVRAAVRDRSLTALRIAEDLRAHIRVMPEVELISPQELQERTFPANKRKRTIFFDLR